MSDYAALTPTPLPPTAQKISQSAPSINLRIFQLSRPDLVDHLDNGQVEMAFGSFANLPSRMRRMPVPVETETLVVRADHP